MSRKRVFHTWPKHEQFRKVLQCFNMAVQEAAVDPSVLDKFKDDSGSKLFKLAATFDKHLKPEDFEELRTITVYEIGRNIVSGKRVEQEQEKEENDN